MSKPDKESNSVQAIYSCDLPREPPFQSCSHQLSPSTPSCFNLSHLHHDLPSATRFFRSRSASLLAGSTHRSPRSRARQLLLIRHRKACGFLTLTCLLQSNDSRLRELDLPSSHCLGIRPEENIQADGNPCGGTRTSENKRPAYANVASPSFSVLANPVVVRPRKRDRHVERIANVFSKVH